MSVTVTPPNVTLQAGQTQLYTATVTGSTNTAVTWTATGGTVTSSGLYTAGSAAGNFSVIAKSSADTTKTSTATVTVQPAAVSVTVTPPNVSLQAGQTQQFSATVTGSTNTVYGMRAKTDNSGTFTDKSSLWSSSSMNLSGAQPFAMDVDPDGMADLALVQPDTVQWLRTIERSSTPAEMVLSSQFPHEGQDTTPPTAPTGLTATAGAGFTINLSWHASSDDSGGAVTYRVYRDGTAIGTAQTGLTYVDQLVKVTTHSYTVRAFDGAGNRSDPSNKVTIKSHS